MQVYSRSVIRIPPEQIANSLWVVVDGICISSRPLMPWTYYYYDYDLVSKWEGNE